MTGTELIPTSPTAIDREIADLERDTRSRGYWKDDQAQARLRALYDARDRGAPLPAKRSRTEVELAKLNHDMRFGDYHRNPEKQAKYRELLDSLAGTGPAVAELDSLRASLPPAIVKEWSTATPGFGFSEHAELAKATIGTIAAFIRDPSLRAEFQLSATTLPPNVQTVLLRESTLGMPGYSRAADRTELEAALPHFGALIQAWGRDAPRRFGIFADRFQRIVSSLKGADLATFDRWWKHLSVSEIQACAWVLSGSAMG
jgi:hypothetical protein